MRVNYLLVGYHHKYYVDCSRQNISRTSGKSSDLNNRNKYPHQHLGRALGSSKQYLVIILQVSHFCIREPISMQILMSKVNKFTFLTMP